MSRPTKPVAMCCVSIGYQSFLLPATKGMQLVELMQSAFECEPGFRRDHVYTVGEQPQVEYRAVKAQQIIPPAAPAPVGTPALEHAPRGGLFDRGD